jgi:hypothetical protein
MGFQVFDEHEAYNLFASLVAGNGTGPNALIAVQTKPLRIDAIYVANNDTIAHVFNLYFFNGAGSIYLGSVNIPAGTGTLGTPTIDVLAACLPPTLAGFVIASGFGLQWGVDVAMSGGKTLYGTAVGGYV